MDDILLSIDVGTGSLRCALASTDGRILAQQRQSIHCWHPCGKMGFSSHDIWNNLTECIQNLVTLSHYDATLIRGIGLDATASLVLLTKGMKPIALPDNPECDIIGWMDHRALHQARQFSDLMANSGSSQKMIPEFNIAKILWVKQVHPELWGQCHCLMDLTDYLVWKLTDCITYTNCSLVRRFDDTLTTALDLADIHLRLKGEHLSIGAPAGQGLSPPVAKATKLPTGIPVASAIVDGYGGSLATVLARHEDGAANTPDIALKRLSMIVGTSTIYIATSTEAKDITGAWGPVPSALPGLFHNTVGQSAAGILLDHTLTRHPAYERACSRARHKGNSITEYLNQKLEDMAGNHPVSYLTQHLHILPYSAGNRCPRMDMTLTGMVSGLRMDDSEEHLALHYLATLQALALGARHNIQTLQDAGYEFNLLTPAGGLAKNPLFIREHCNATGLPIALPEQPDAMLLAGVMTAGLACGLYSSWLDAMQSVSRYRDIINPDVGQAEFYNKKYAVFLQMHKDQMHYKEMMTQDKFGTQKSPTP